MTTALPAREAPPAQAERTRRRRRSVPDAVAPAGRPIRSTLLRLPFVIAMIVVLGCGVSGVLYFNTKADASGIRTQQANATAAQLRLEIESLQRSVAELRSTPHLARRAQQLGLVPAGDAAIMVIDSNGSGDLVGSPRAAGEGDSNGDASEATR